MSKKKISSTDPFARQKKPKEKIFDCLYESTTKERRGLTTEELKKASGLSYTTVWRALNELRNFPYTVNTTKYCLFEENNIYYIVKETDTEKIDELYKSVIAYLADNKASAGCCRMI